MTGYEKICLDAADHFIATRGRGGVGSRRTRARFETIADAVAYAESVGDGRTMIYAVTADGASAHIRNA